MSDDPILRQYETAIYEIYEPNIILHVGRISSDVDALLEQHGCEQWAFVTPYNPYPQTLSDAENEKRLTELQALTESYVTYAGEGRDENVHVSQFEKGLYIFGIEVEEARNLGNHFAQKAILVGEKGKPVELLALK